MHDAGLGAGLAPAGPAWLGSLAGPADQVRYGGWQDGMTMVDPRAVALGQYLRQHAADFSMSADVTDNQVTARAGMALLDAAALVESWPVDHPFLVALSDAGRFEALPDGAVLFCNTPQMRAAVHRPLAGAAMTAQAILDLVVRTATASHD